MPKISVPPPPDTTGCAECADVETPNPNTPIGAALACLIDHHRRAHNLRPEPLRGCDGCDYFWTGRGAEFPPHLLAYFRDHEYGRHVLASRLRPR